MKLLMVTPNLPFPTGGANARNYHLLQALACKHTVSLLAFVSSAELEAGTDLSYLEELTHVLRIVPCAVNGSKRLQQFMSMARGKSYVLDSYRQVGVQAALNAIISQERYDGVFFESVFVACCELPAGTLSIIDQHNIEHELLQRIAEREKVSLRKWYNWRESRLLKRSEIEYCRKADIVLVVSEREREVLKQFLPDQWIEVVSNGVDTESFQEDHLHQEVANQIIFTGTMDYYPNISAVLFFARYCWPLIREQIPTASWLIVGKNPPTQVRQLSAIPGITVTGAVPDMRPYLASSAVAIAPLLAGSGTRLKILEAFSMQKAVVSTTIGCEGLAVIPEKHLLVADGPVAFAQAVVTLLRNPHMRISLGRAGRALVEDEYSWDSCGARLLRILEEKERTLIC